MPPAPEPTTKTSTSLSHTSAIGQNPLSYLSKTKRHLIPLIERGLLKPERKKIAT